MRCDHCGRDKEEAYRACSYSCNPPFTVQTHSFTGQHPADQREMAMNKHGDKGLWRFIPEVGRPFNPAYHSVWGLMTHREKQFSFLFDVIVVLLATVLGWFFS
jgi:hypothetical protein